MAGQEPAWSESAVSPLLVPPRPWLVMRISAWPSLSMSAMTGVSHSVSELRGAL